MNSPLKNRFELQIKALEGFGFQDFVVELFLHKYGATGFTVLRRKKDKGCDGIVNEENRVIACYGPAKNDQKKFDKKADEDFADFTSNWQSSHPNWTFVVNQEVTPAQEKKIKNLKSDASILGIRQVLSIIEGLQNYKRKKLAEYLKIEPEFIGSDYVGEMLDDLLKGSSIAATSIKYDKNGRVNLGEKISLNFDGTDIDEAINEYGSFAENGALSAVSDLLSGYEDEEIDRLKNRILYDYSNLTNGAFKTRLKTLSEHYLNKYSNEKDDDYLFYIRAVLVLLFEQCLIGAKTHHEK